MDKNTILEVNNLSVGFKTEFGFVKPVTGVSFNLRKNETLGIVGESGCGKSVTAYSVIQLLPGNAVIDKESSINFNGKDILKLSKDELTDIRGNKISMIFQEPMTSLNPVYTIGWQLSEAFQLHMDISDEEALKRSVELLRLVRIPQPEKRVHEYPHQMSGGMRQRVMIAMALACNPSLLIADEPTTALDVTTQAQILELMNNLKKEIDTSIIMITHDLGVIAEMCDRVIIMYAGEIIEEGDVFEIFDSPEHPYTKGLLKSIPNIEISKTEQEKLETIEGFVPHPSRFPKGCRFAPRCAQVFEKCKKESPDMFKRSGEHSVKCWLYENEEKGGE